MQKAYRTEGALGQLRDQRPHQCNIDDLLRMEALPKGAGPGVCYRDLPGVVTNSDSEFHRPSHSVMSGAYTLVAPITCSVHRIYDTGSEGMEAGGAGWFELVVSELIATSPDHQWNCLPLAMLHSAGLCAD
jgi:hypothetical protein